jgi:FAD/FMN-containing dehydrogenase
VEVGDHSPDELTLDLVLATELDGTKSVSIDCCYLGSEVAGRAPTDSLLVPNSPILIDSRLFRGYAEWQRTFDNPYRRGRRSYWKSVYINRFDAAFVSLLTEAIADAPSPHTILTFDHVHGSASRVPFDATAFSHRGDRYLFLINTNWNDPADDDVNIRWTRELFDEVRRFGSNAVYVNYLSEEGAARVQAAYGDSTYDRLTSIKSKYDPKNVFHHNQNVAPAGSVQP